MKGDEGSFSFYPPKVKKMTKKFQGNPFKWAALNKLPMLELKNF